MLGRTDSRARLLLLLAVMLAISSGMALRLAYWQVNQHEQLAALSGTDTYSQRYIAASVMLPT